MYTPALTGRLVTAAAPLTPVIVVGPVAVSGKLVTVAVPPLSLTTVLTSVSVAGRSLLVIVQVALWPLARVSWLPDRVPAVQLHAPAA